MLVKRSKLKDVPVIPTPYLLIVGVFVFIAVGLRLGDVEGLIDNTGISDF